MVATCPGFAGVYTCCIGVSEAADEQNDGFAPPLLPITLPSIEVIIAENPTGYSPIVVVDQGHSHVILSFCHQRELTWAAIVIFVTLVSLLSLMLGPIHAYRNAEDTSFACGC